MEFIHIVDDEDEEHEAKGATHLVGNEFEGPLPRALLLNYVFLNQLIQDMSDSYRHKGGNDPNNNLNWNPWHLCLSSLEEKEGSSN